MHIKKFKFKGEIVNVEDVDFLKIVGDNTHYKIESAVTFEFLILVAVDDPQKEQQITTDEIAFIEFVKKEEADTNKNSFLQQLQAIENTNESPAEILNAERTIQPMDLEEEKQDVKTAEDLLLDLGRIVEGPQEEKPDTIKTENVEADEKEKLIDAITFLIREGLRANLK